MRARVRIGRAGLLAAVAVLAMTACSDGAERSEDSGEVTASGDVGAFDLQVGDCVDDPPTGATTTEVSDLAAVPCDQEHTGEIYYLVDLEDGDYPGEEEVSASADEACAAEFEAFVGLAYEQSRLEISTLFPTRESWEDLDDREVVCIVVDPTGPLTGSARNLGEAAAAAEPGTSAGGVPPVGTCLDVNGAPVDCATAHDSELYAVVDLPDGAWPGQEAVDASAEQACLDQFAGYVGVAYDQSALEFAYLPPDDTSWAAGDRQVGCLAVDPAGPLTGSVRGTGR